MQLINLRRPITAKVYRHCAEDESFTTQVTALVGEIRMRPATLGSVPLRTDGAGQVQHDGPFYRIKAWEAHLKSRDGMWLSLGPITEKAREMFMKSTEEWAKVNDWHPEERSQPIMMSVKIDNIDSVTP